MTEPRKSSISIRISDKALKFLEKLAKPDRIKIDKAIKKILNGKGENMAIRVSAAEWKGTLKEGSGTLKLASGAYEGPYTYASRFESGRGTNPEELIGAAHAACFSMFLAALLSGAGFVPERIATTAKVHLGEGPTITLIELDTKVWAPKLSEEYLQKHAEAAKKNCPVSKALAGPEIRLHAELQK
jgi:osmotically inducible protein OsmC